MPGGRTRRAGPASTRDVHAGAACRPRAPSQGSPGRPACPGSPAGEGLPWQRGDAGGTHRPGPRRGDRRAPEGSSAEQRRRDQTIRRPPEPDWPDPDLLPLSGASERRSGAAFRTRRRQPLSPQLLLPSQGTPSGAWKHPQPIQGVPAHPSGSLHVQVTRKWMLVGADPCGSPHAGSCRIPPGCTLRWRKELGQQQHRDTTVML